MRIPRFHSLGDDDGHFYAVAYVVGTYVPPSGRSQSDAFHVLDFSPSVGFTRFSYSTVSPDGDILHYTRGVDELDSAEYALLRAWSEERVPTNAWRLFPSASIEEAAFGGDLTARAAYENARRRVALILYHARAHIWARTQFPTEPLFRPSESEFPQPMVDSPDYEEIAKYVAQSAT